MLTSSAKAKGRKLQQWVRTLLIEKLNIHPEDIERDQSLRKIFNVTKCVTIVLLKFSIMNYPVEEE